MNIAYFAQHQLDELDAEGSAYDAVRRLMPDAPEAKVRARAGQIGFPEQKANTKVVEPVGRREGAAAARACDLFRAASRHSRRADQPSRHRQPRGPDRGDQRLSGRGDPGLARPLSAGGLRRPAAAGRRRRGRRRSTATSTITAAMCSAKRRVKPKAARAPRASRTNARARSAEKRAELAPLRSASADAEAADQEAQRRSSRKYRCGAGGRRTCSRAIRPRPRSFRKARSDAARRARARRRGMARGQRRIRNRDAREAVAMLICNGGPATLVGAFAGLPASSAWAARSLRHALDRNQPPAAEAIDAGPWSAAGRSRPRCARRRLRSRSRHCPGEPARCTTSHSVIASAMPPAMAVRVLGASAAGSGVRRRIRTLRFGRRATRVAAQDPSALIEIVRRDRARRWSCARCRTSIQSGRANVLDDLASAAAFERIAERRRAAGERNSRDDSQHRAHGATAVMIRNVSIAGGKTSWSPDCRRATIAHDLLVTIMAAGNAR